MSYDETPEEYRERMALNGRIHDEEEAKEEGMARAAANSASFEDMKDAIRYDASMAGVLRTVTADTARAVLEQSGFSVDNPNAWGAAFNVVAKEGTIRQAGVTKSEREGRHRSNITEWVAC
jgi:hypothetical protein